MQMEGVLLPGSINGFGRGRSWVRKGIADHDMNIQLFGPTNTTLNICNYQGQGTLMHGTRNTVSWRVDLIFFVQNS